MDPRNNFLRKGFSIRAISIARTNPDHTYSSRLSRMRTDDDRPLTSNVYYSPKVTRLVHLPVDHDATNFPLWDKLIHLTYSSGCLQRVLIAQDCARLRA